MSKHFILLNIVVNGIVFLNSFLDFSLLVYKIYHWFLHIDYLYCNFAELVISSNSILVDYLGVSIYKIISPLTRGGITAPSSL